MKGIVNSRGEATLRIRLLGRGRQARTVTTVIDTGYSGAITLPPRVVRSLRLRHLGQTDAELGDGRIATFAVFEGAVVWNGKRVRVEISEANTDPLLGMELLNGFRLTIDAERGGAVTILPLR